MLCPICGTSNYVDNNFCIQCGTKLTGEAREALATDLHHLHVRLGSLSSQVDRITTALTEAGLKIQGSEPSPAPLADLRIETLSESTRGIPSAGPVSPTLGAQGTVGPEIPVKQRADGELAQDRPGAWTSGGGVRNSPIAKAISNFDWEPIIGGNWLARVGALAIIIGVAFFLALAFDNNWINEPARVVLGVAVGTAFIGAGEYWRKKYLAYAQALTGAGVALFYLSIFAAFANYDLIHIYTGVSLLLFISVASSLIAIRHNSVSLAIIGITGAFFAPFILGAFAETGLSARAASATTDAPALLVYIFVVDVGVIVLSTFRNWHWFTALALLGSLWTFGLWHNEYIATSQVMEEHFGRTEALLIAEAGLAGIFVSFLASTTVFHMVWRRIPRRLDLSLILANATLFMGISYGLLWTDFRDWMGGFTILVAAMYGGIGFLSAKRVGLTPIAVKNPTPDMLLTSILLGTGLVLITIAVPIQVGGPWIAVTWAAEGLLLFWLSFQYKMPELRMAGAVAFTGSAFWLGVIDTPNALEESVTPFWNRYMPAYLLVIVFMWGAAFLARRNERVLRKEEKDLFSVISLAAILFLALLIPVQVRGPWLGFWWTLEAVLLLFVAFNQRSRAIRYGALTVLSVSSIWLAAVETPELFDSADTPFWNVLFPLYLVVLAGVATSAYLVKRNEDQLRDDETALFSVLVFTGIGLLALGTPVQLEHEWNTVGWSIEAVLLTWIALRRKVPDLQMMAPLLLLPAAFRALVLDSVVDSDGYTVLWNTRFLSFGPLIVAVCGVSYLWARSDQPTGRGWLRVTLRQGMLPKILVGVANFLALFFLSAEIIGAVQADAVVSVTDRNESDTISLGLTVLWAAYGGLVLGAGFIGHWRAVRLGGLILLAIPVFKLFLVDSFQLDQGFRVAAFLSLGAILLIGGYVYQRNAELFNELFIGRRRSEVT